MCVLVLVSVCDTNVLLYVCDCVCLAYVNPNDVCWPVLQRFRVSVRVLAALAVVCVWECEIQLSGCDIMICISTVHLPL